MERVEKCWRAFFVRVGLVAYPLGPRVEPTTDHAQIARALETVVGARMPLTGRFLLRPSEIVDISTTLQGGRGDASATEVLRRECGSDRNCIDRLIMEVRTAIQLLETMTIQSVGGLRAVLQALGAIPDRKNVVLITAGLITGDRPGARPDVSDLAMLAGQDAARSNVTLYTVLVDQSAISQFSAERRSGAFNRYTSSARDSQVLGRWYDQVSGTAGGALITDVIGSGELGFTRILNKTSAYYRLGIEPTSAIRDGRPHQIRIKVNARRVTVRGRSWVILPVR